MILVHVEVERNIKIVVAVEFYNADDKKNSEQKLTVRSFFIGCNELFLLKTYLHMIGKFILYIGFVLSLLSCTSVREISVDCLQPADVCFPALFRNVGVVDNMTALGGWSWNPVSDRRDSLTFYRAMAYPNADRGLVLNSLAQTIADRNYFNSVVVCDSLLQESGDFFKGSQLSVDEVRELTEQMGVDFLISLENVGMRALKTIDYIPEYMICRGVVDVSLAVKVSAYVPGRDKPMFSIIAVDSIFWDAYGTDDAYVRTHIVSDEQLVEEASAVAGALVVNKLLPHWKTLQRFYYATGTPKMRNAALFMHERNWRGARELWMQEYNSVYRKDLKICLAYNIALSYELEDQLEKAIEWAQVAKELTLKRVSEREYSVFEKNGFKDVPYYPECTAYLESLKLRQADLNKLNLQLRCLDDDF